MKDEIIVYSYLATLNNTKKYKEYLSLYKDVVLNTLFIMSNETNEFLVEDLRLKIFEVYTIDIPHILIEKIINTYISSENALISKDGAIILKNIVLDEYREIIRESSCEIELLEEDYIAFLQEQGLEMTSSIFDLVEFYKQKILNLDKVDESEISTLDIQLKFLRKIERDIEKKKTFQKILWGAVLTKCLFSSDAMEGSFKGDILLLDTSFIISLLGLHKDSSNRTCRQVVKISNVLGFDFRIFDQTIQEAKKLILDTAEFLKNDPPISDIFSNDITLACYHNAHMTPTEMERIANNIEIELRNVVSFKIEMIEKLRHKVESSDLYKYYMKKLNKEKISAFHDASAIAYVSNCRGGDIKKVEDAKCWFVQERKNRTNALRNNERFINERISSHDLLLLVWMSSPQTLDYENTSEIEFQKVISLGQNIDKKQMGIIKQFEDNFKMYASAEITTEELARLQRKVVSMSVDEIDSLNSDNSIVFNQNLREVIQQQLTEESEMKSSYESELLEREKKLLEVTEEMDNLKNEYFGQNEKIDEINSRVKLETENRENIFKKISAIIDEDENRLSILVFRNSEIKFTLNSVETRCNRIYNWLLGISIILSLICAVFVVYFAFIKPTQWTSVEGTVVAATILGTSSQLLINLVNRLYNCKFSGVIDLVIISVKFVDKLINSKLYKEQELNEREIEKTQENLLKNKDILSITEKIS